MGQNSSCFSEDSNQQREIDNDAARESYSKQIMHVENSSSFLCLNKDLQQSKGCNKSEVQHIRVQEATSITSDSEGGSSCRESGYILVNLRGERIAHDNLVGCEVRLPLIGSHDKFINCCNSLL